MIPPTSTTIVEFKAALVAALKARPALERVSVEYSFNQKSAPANRIFLDNDVDDDEQMTAMRGEGPKPRDEKYYVGVIIETVTPGQTAYEAELLVVTYLKELEAILASAPSLGVDGVHWATLRGKRLHSGQIDRGAAARAECRVEVKSRLV